MTVWWPAGSCSTTAAATTSSHRARPPRCARRGEMESRISARSRTCTASSPVSWVPRVAPRAAAAASWAGHPTHSAKRYGTASLRASLFALFALITLITLHSMEGPHCVPHCSAYLSRSLSDRLSDRLLIASLIRCSTAWPISRPNGCSSAAIGPCALSRRPWVRGSHAARPS